MTGRRSSNDSTSKREEEEQKNSESAGDGIMEPIVKRITAIR